MAILELLSSTATGALSILDRHAYVRQLGLEKRPLQRLLLVECECNLALLACLRLDDPGTPQDDIALLTVSSRLQTDVLEAVFGSDDLGSKVFKSLKKVPLIGALAGSASANESADPKTRGTVSEKLRRLYVNASTVRSAAALHIAFAESRPLGLREMEFKTRLKNLRKVYVKLSEALHSELGDDAA